MKSIHVALLSLAGMLLTSISVYSLTPPGGASSAPDPAALTTKEERDDEAPVAHRGRRGLRGAERVRRGRAPSSGS